MKMWTTVIIVAIILGITSATILFFNDEETKDDQFSINFIESGDEIAENTNDINIISGEIVSGDEVFKNNSSFIENAESGENLPVVNVQKTQNTSNIASTSNTQVNVETEVMQNVNQSANSNVEQTTNQSTSNEIVNTEPIIEQEISEVVINNIVIPENSVGMLNIPKISLTTPVLDGHSLEVLKKGIGHVDETAYWQGNIGILGHNSGNAGYFQHLTKLVVGDKINYTTEHGTRSYEVSQIIQIVDTDWSYLSNTKDNRITLITCVKGVPEKRLCIQATEIF